MYEPIIYGMSQDEEDTQKDKFLTFMIDNEIYGVEFKHVDEIIGMQPIIEIPENPEYVRGIINLRGDIITVVDTRIRFNMPIREYDDRTCIIILNVDDFLIGLIIDRIYYMYTIKEDSIVLCSDAQASKNNFVKSIAEIENTRINLLDCGKLA